jgi:hypothetical protein
VVPKGSDGGEWHSELLTFWPLFVVRCSETREQYSVPETGTVSSFKREREASILFVFHVFSPILKPNFIDTVKYIS